MARRLFFLALVIGAAIVAVVVFEPLSLFDDEPAPEAAERESSLVTTQSLVTEFTADGSFVHDGAATAYASTLGPSGPAVITAVVAEGSVANAGDVLWEIGFEPTVLLVGSEPSHRDLGRDDVGSDVLQLELNLVALGFDPDGTVTIDETYTYNTSLMVERWQEAAGAEVTGAVAQGAVVYAPPDRRVGAVDVIVGATITDGQAILELTGQNREVVFEVSSADRETLEIGAAVVARLPDRTELSATVTTTTVTETGGLAVVASIEDSPDLAADNLPATMTWSTTLATDAVTVPESALLRLDTGGYVVERADNGALVPVEPGASSNGWVEITSTLTPGDPVIAP